MSRRRTSLARSTLWFVPVMCVLAGAVLSVTTMAIDRATGFDMIPRWLTGGPDAALAILATIATSMVALTTLVLTITMVVVQLAMGQFSPRIVQTFLRDRPSQVAIGLFVATFVHSMLAMLEVNLGDDGGQVPGIAIAVAYVLVLASIAMLVFYVDHIGRSLRVSSLIELVGEVTRRVLDEKHPEQLLDAPTSQLHEVAAPNSGVVVDIDIDKLTELARAADCVLRVAAPLGSYVVAGAPLLLVDGESRRLDRDETLSAITLGLERNLDGDLAYGFRLLVDVAERALSESAFNDPTTAVQAIDRLHDGLRHLATRVIHDGAHRDSSGELRVVTCELTWDDYVHLAFDEIRLAGAGSPQVTRRLASALNDLIDASTPERRPPLREQLDLLKPAPDVIRDARDVQFSLRPDSQGIGASHEMGSAATVTRPSARTANTQ